MEIKLNTIYQSDCVVLMESMEANSVDLTVTSPPYDKLRNYNGYDFNFDKIARGLSLNATTKILPKLISARIPDLSN